MHRQEQRSRKLLHQKDLLMGFYSNLLSEPYTLSWTSQSAKPYKEKAFESRSQMWSSSEGSRAAGLCPRRDEEFRRKVGKHVPWVPKRFLWSLNIQPGLKGLF